MVETTAKVILLAALTLLSGNSLAQDDADLQARYGKSCAVCHAAGAAGAPKTGAVEEWEPRLAKGMDTLVQSVQNGLNAMPPKGMCFDCSPAQYEALIEYMARAR
jgi:cytochrome c5